MIILNSLPTFIYELMLYWLLRKESVQVYKGPFMDIKARKEKSAFWKRKDLKRLFL